MQRRVGIHTEIRPLRAPFAFSGQYWTECALVICEIEQGGVVGRGEAYGVYYRPGQNVSQMLEAIEAVARQLEQGLTREALQTLMPAGGARNAIDCALWDIEAKLSGKSVWELAGVKPEPVLTVYPIGLEVEPEQMAEKATLMPDYPLLKIKLNGDRPVQRVEAIRAARPDARLLVDANQGWDFAQLREVAPALRELGVGMIEQPLPCDQDSLLEDYRSPVPLCADESCQHRGDLDQVEKRYQMISIKLDKTGGLTEALLLAKEARKRGLGITIGSMPGTSLSMGPTHVLAQLCEYSDLDGPFLLRRDRVNPMQYRAGWVSLPLAPGWGSPC